MFFIGGFHRTGSTLISSILCQNPEIHIEGKSALCQIMWDNHKSLDSMDNLIKANQKKYLRHDLLSKIPQIYYNNNTRSIVFDKNPYWTNANNIKMIEDYICKDFKMIVLYRNTIEILQSSAFFNIKNNYLLKNPIIETFPDILFNSEDFFALVEKGDHNKYLFIDYNDFVNEPQKNIELIYKFLNIKNFHHEFSNIKKYLNSSSDFYDMNGLYEVRSKIEKRKIFFELDDVSIKICSDIDKKIKNFKEIGLC